MLHPARQGLTTALPTLRAAAAASASSACFLALPAESSRQALLRFSTSSATPLSSAARISDPERLPSVTSRRKVRGLARYSGAAVALDEDREDVGMTEALHEAESWPSRANARESGLDTRYHPIDDLAQSPDPPDYPTSAEISAPSMASTSASAPPAVLQVTNQDILDVFRSLAQNHPIEALQTLPRLSIQQRAKLSSNQIDTLLVALTELAKQNPDTVASSDLGHIQSLLAMIPDILDSIASANPACAQQASSQLSRIPLKNKRLVRFLRVCAYYGALPLAMDVWRETVYLQRQLGTQRIIMPDDIARVLAARKHWSTLLAFFSPQAFERSWLTPLVLEKYTQALLATGRPEEVQAAFELHSFPALGGQKLKPTSQSYAYLVQAHLSVGDVNQARHVAAKAKKAGLLSEEEQQMAILRGHRSLGMDARMERRILDDLKRLDMEPRPRVLNMLIRLRLDAEHVAGARELLRYFDLERLGLPSRSPLRAGPIAPDYETLKLAFNVIAKSDDLAMTRFVWHRLNELQSPVEDEHLLILIYALGRQDLADEAYRIVRAIVNDRPQDCPLPLQQGFKVGVKSLNALLTVLARAGGYDGLAKASSLFRKARVQPDDFTVKIVLDFAKQEGRGRAADLGRLLVELLQSAPHLKPSIHQLDTIISHAVTARTLSEQAAVVLNDRLSVNDPAENLRLRSKNPAFKASMQAIIQSLLARKRRGTSRALATRLHFDAQRFSSGHNVPSPREIWSTLIARGYQPDHRHLLALMRGYTESGHMHEAEEVVELAGTHIGPDAVNRMYKMLITGWGKAGNYSRAQSAFASVRNSPRGADLAALTALIDAAHSCRHHATAAALVHGELERFLQHQPLDARAAQVAARSLRAHGEEMAAMQLMRRLDGGALDKGLRLQIRRIRSWARRLLAQAHGTVPDATTLRAGRVKGRSSNARRLPGRTMPSKAELEKVLREADALLAHDDRLRPKHTRHIAGIASPRGRRKLRRALMGWRYR